MATQAPRPVGGDRLPPAAHGGGHRGDVDAHMLAAAMQQLSMGEDKAAQLLTPAGDGLLGRSSRGMAPPSSQGASAMVHSSPPVPVSSPPMAPPVGGPQAYSHDMATSAGLTFSAQTHWPTHYAMEVASLVTHPDASTPSLSEGSRRSSPTHVTGGTQRPGGNSSYEDPAMEAARLLAAQEAPGAPQYDDAAQQAADMAAEYARMHMSGAPVGYSDTMHMAGAVHMPMPAGMYGGGADPYGGGPPTAIASDMDPHLAHALATSVRVFVGKLSSSTTTESLQTYFIEFLRANGYPAPEQAVVDVYAPLDVSGRQRGFAFVSFADRSTVDLVIRYPHHYIDGRHVLMDVAAPRGFKVDPITAARGPAGQHMLAVSMRRAPPAVHARPAYSRPTFQIYPRAQGGGGMYGGGPVDPYAGGATAWLPMMAPPMYGAGPEYGGGMDPAAYMRGGPPPPSHGMGAYDGGVPRGGGFSAGGYYGPPTGMAPSFTLTPPTGAPWQQMPPPRGAWPGYAPPPRARGGGDSYPMPPRVDPSAWARDATGNSSGSSETQLTGSAGATSSVWSDATAGGAAPPPRHVA